ncbi:MAG: hypothetical protein V2A34_03295, partial [Lentisphaerota bacterium]
PRQAASMTWHLKKSDGTVYGAAEIDTLQRWAMDGRIAPEDFMSPDQAQWKPAHEIAELDMIWEVDVGENGIYGPVHILALRDHVRDGSIPAESMIRNTRTGLKSKVSEALLQAVLEDNSLMQANLEALEARLRDTEFKLLELQKQPVVEPELPPTQAPESQEASGNKYQFERDALKWKRMYQEEREGNRRKEESFIQRIEELRQNERTAQGAIERMDRHINQLEKDQKAFHQVLDSGDKQSHMSLQAITLMSNLETLSQNYDRLMRQVTEKSAENQGIRESCALVEQHAEERIRQAEEQLKREKDEAIRLRLQLAQMEETHMNLVRSYRDLNDRFIRALQDQPQPLSPQTETKTAPKDSQGKSRIRLTR